MPTHVHWFGTAVLQVHVDHRPLVAEWRIMAMGMVATRRIPSSILWSPVPLTLTTQDSDTSMQRTECKTIAKDARVHMHRNLPSNDSNRGTSNHAA